MKLIKLITMSVIAGSMASCQHQKEADLMIHNANIYTVDKDFSVSEAMVIKGERVIATGDYDELRRNYKVKELLDAGGRPVYPGFIDGHCHFYGYGIGLIREVSLVGTSSFEEILDRLVSFHEKYPSEWIIGRGWDQNDWPVKEFPDNKSLNELFPGNPVVLIRIDGHAAVANAEALSRAGIDERSHFEGGDIIIKDGRLTGLLIDKASDFMKDAIPEPNYEDRVLGLKEAEKNCFSVGLTSVVDAGLDREVIELIDSMHSSGNLKMKVTVMLSANDENLKHYLETEPYKTPRLHVNSIKLYADGALGSRGALMIEPYDDDPGNTGLLVTSREMMEQTCRRALESGFQVNTHCIGDSAARLVLDIYGSILGGQNDRRWRIEHAQVVHPDDFRLFDAYDVIPSVQATHCTSDMPWAEDRVGPERIRGAYALKTLLDQNGWLVNGTDFPIEDINPVYTFYTSVFRKPPGSKQEERYLESEALTRQEALRSITIWAAKGSFEENEKGSLEAGKLADFVILDEDLMTAPEERVAHIKVWKTFSSGEQVYTR